MANYKVKRKHIVCLHQEVLSTPTTMYVNEKGGYIHAVCKTELDYVGTSQARGSETEVFFWCAHCLEGVSLPLLQFMRVEIRLRDTRGDCRSPLLDYGVVLAGDSVPAHDEGDRPRLHRTTQVKEVPHEVDTGKCKLCNLPHLVPPVASTR